MQILDHQHQRDLLAQAAQQPEHQLEQPDLRGLGRLASPVRRTQRGQQAGQLRPRRTDQPADLHHADLSDQRPQGLNDRRIGQGAVAHRHAAARQHPGPVGGATADQLGDQACLANPGLAPHQDDGRLGGCRPPPGRLKDLELLDAAHKGRAGHAAAHLAGIIPHARPEGNGGRVG
jgi:hypothetical protein